LELPSQRWLLARGWRDLGPPVLYNAGGKNPLLNPLIEPPELLKEDVKDHGLPYQGDIRFSGAGIRETVV
jgi:hypothetical protein